MRDTAKKKILFVCTEDWFFASHFRPLADAALAGGERRASLVAKMGRGGAGIEATGLGLVPFDFARADLRIFSALAQLVRLTKILRRERPDLVHFIGLKPIVIGGLAALAVPRTACIYHLVGQGLSAVSTGRRIGLIRAVALRLARFHLRRPRSWLFVENPDDRDALGLSGADVAGRITMLGGAGVDPGHFAAIPAPDNVPVRLAYIGRMIWSKGVDVLVDAMARLRAKGIAAELHLHGTPDPGNPQSLSEEELRAWNGRNGVHWHGFSTDVRTVWRASDIAVVPSRGGEGLPRSLLEAAACARPLIVTDVPGCRHFVRDGIEGLVVAPADPEALAAAIERLCSDRALRQAMGQAARKRILEGFTEAHVRAAAAQVYETLLRPA